MRNSLICNVGFLAIPVVMVRHDAIVYAFPPGIVAAAVTRLAAFEPARTLLIERIDKELSGTVWGSTTVKTRLVMADLAADDLLTALEDRRPRPCLIRRPTFDRPAYGVTTEDHAGEPDGRGGQ